MRAFPTSLAVLASATLLAGCATTAPPGVETSAVPTETPTPTVTWRSEAPVTLQVGKAVDLTQTRGLSKAVVTVESIQENATCPTGGATPKNGQFVVVKLSAQRTDNSEMFQLGVYDWGAVDNAGHRTPANAGLVTGLCLTDGSALKGAWDASGRAAGTLLLDVPTNPAALVATNTMATPNVTLTVEMPAR